MKSNSLTSLAILALLSFTVQAETLNTSLEKCAKIQDDLARLGCFDDLVEHTLVPVNGNAKASIETPTAKIETLAVPVVTKATKATKAANFGAEHLKKSNVDEDDLQVVFTVEKLSKDQYGKLRFTFKNGQQWQQTDSTFLSVKVGDSVLLTKGFMNAIYLKKNKPNSSKKIRIKRQK